MSDAAVCGLEGLRPAAPSLEGLLAEQALRRLALAYCHAVDRRDFPLVRSLYHDDAIDDHGGMFHGGPDAFVAWLPTALAQWSLTSHAVHNALYIVHGDEADGELLATAYHRSADATREVIAHGRYLDRYRRRGGLWKFLRRSLVLDWLEERALGVPGVAAHEGVERARPSADDASYRCLPLFAAQRAPGGSGG